MEPINKIINKRVNQLGLQKTLQAARIVAIANTLGNDRYEAICYSRNVLTVNCSNGLIAQELQCDHQQMIKSLNQKLGEPLVHRVKIQIRS